jgi:hypothetical protein
MPSPSRPRARHRRCRRSSPEAPDAGARPPRARHRSSCAPAQRALRRERRMGGCRTLTLAPVGMSPNGRILVVRRAHGDDKKAQIPAICRRRPEGSNRSEAEDRHDAEIIMWMAPACKRFEDGFGDQVGCGHMSGPFVRRAAVTSALARPLRERIYSPFGRRRPRRQRSSFGVIDGS